MARIDDLIALVSDKGLREKLDAALIDMKRRQRFGLVYEEHVPETTTLLHFPVQAGSTVQRKSDTEGKQLYLVRSIEGDTVLMEPEGGGKEVTASTRDLLVVKRFGDPIFPILTALGAVRQGEPDRPHHAVINGENFHALQLLVYLFEGQVDCIYIDPPYNTGNRDWKYNNRYVDNTDTWRHSKWLGFMEKRLRLAARLLKPDGVLIVTIDEHEVHHLGMLLEKVFPDPGYLRYTVNAVINPKGTYKHNFGRVDEQIFFVVPNLDRDVIVPRPLGSDAEANPDEVQHSLVRKLLGLAGAHGALPDNIVFEPEEQAIVDASFESEENEEDDPDLNTEEGVENVIEDDDGNTVEYEYWFLRRRGQESSYRTQRPNQFFAINVDVANKEVLGVGPLLGKTDSYEITKSNSIVSIYPIDNEGHERVWRYSRETMQKYIDASEICVGKFNKKTGNWTLNHKKLKKGVRRHKTVWWEKRHDAGVHGTNVLNNLLGRRNLFPFPKSIYAVHDALAAVVRNRPNALILDFFAGSGTTFHSTCLLNAEDGGSRRSILVTNNEVGETLVRKFHKQGIYRGDDEFEQQGIFSLVTRPRCEAVITGRRPDGKPVPGKHITGRPFAQGFPENLELFRVDYTDADDVDLGNQFEAIYPSLWLAAGGIGERTPAADRRDMLIPENSPLAILFQEERFRKFGKAIAGRADITHIWLVTDSEDAFAEMRSALPSRLIVSMLYRDYLRNFRINTRHNL
nr:hypothetical protein NG677_17250 [Methylobacterium sp. OTU13CASTA1]